MDYEEASKMAFLKADNDRLYQAGEKLKYELALAQLAVKDHKGYIDALKRDLVDANERTKVLTKTGAAQIQRINELQVLRENAEETARHLHTFNASQAKRIDTLGNELATIRARHSFYASFPQPPSLNAVPISRPDMEALAAEAKRVSIAKMIHQFADDSASLVAKMLTVIR